MYFSTSQQNFSCCFALIRCNTEQKLHDTSAPVKRKLYHVTATLKIALFLLLNWDNIPVIVVISLRPSWWLFTFLVE